MAPEGATAVLLPWSSFYAVTGTASAGLTGLMFVVITLISDAERRAREDGIATFSTPTIVHFCLAFLTSAVLIAPWPSLSWTAMVLLLVGIGGIFYALRMVRFTRGQSAYVPDLEDWIWYSVVPFAAYVGLLAGAVWLQVSAKNALFLIGASTVLLIFVGIHNAWDVVTFLALGKDRDIPPRQQS